MNISWIYEQPAQEEGILVASDARSEWMLPWWWERYRRDNNRPVAFVDLGLSKAMQRWCRSRGAWLPLQGPRPKVAGREETDPERIATWEFLYGPHFWAKRPLFFQKPLACLLTPFASTLWLDLDCEIRYCLDELFAYKGRFAISRDLIVSFPGKPIYNSGVFLFSHRHPLIERWVQMSFTSHGQFYSDQDILSHLLREKEEPFTELPSLYQWSHFLGENGLSRIVHWHGEKGKQAIRNQMQLS